MDIGTALQYGGSPNLYIKPNTFTNCNLVKIAGKYYVCCKKVSNSRVRPKAGELVRGRHGHQEPGEA